jgi:hypothetical protein
VNIVFGKAADALEHISRVLRIVLGKAKRCATRRRSVRADKHGNATLATTNDGFRLDAEARDRRSKRETC